MSPWTEQPLNNLVVIVLSAIAAIVTLVFALLSSGCPWPGPTPWPTPTPWYEPTPFPIPTYTPIPIQTPTATAIPPSPTATIVTPTSTPAPGPDITFLDDPDVGSWPQTSTITDVRTSPGEVCIDHTMAGRWPLVKTAEGNPLVVTKIGGKWLAWSYEYLGPGQKCKAIDTAQWGAYSNCAACGQVKGWHPQPGEQIGLLVTTVVRAGVPHGLPSQRSDIRWVRW